jgi:hypothetical protein
MGATPDNCEVLLEQLTSRVKDVTLVVKPRVARVLNAYVGLIRRVVEIVLRSERVDIVV